MYNIEILEILKDNTGLGSVEKNGFLGRLHFVRLAMGGDGFICPKPGSSPSPSASAAATAPTTVTVTVTFYLGLDV